MSPTRRQALAGAGALLTGLSGCSGTDDTTATATATERGYAETVADPERRTVRNATGEPAVRSTLANPVEDWADADWLVASRDDREALYFADAPDGVDDARSFVGGTDFSSSVVLVHQHPVDACEEWSLERLRWGAADAEAPPGSAAVELGYRTVGRGDCEDGPRDVAATIVRIPARFERVTSFSVWVS